MLQIRRAIIVMVLLLLLPVHAAAATVQYALGTEKLITMNEAIDLGIKRNSNVKEAMTNVSKAKAEWTQAQLAVIHQSAKDSGPFAKPHSLSEDLQFRMKLPEVRKSLQDAKDQLSKQSRDAELAIRRLYIHAVSTAENERTALQRKQQAELQLNETKLVIRLGKAKQDDVANAQQIVEQASSEYKQAQLAGKSAKLELGKAIGLNLESGYMFIIDQMYADLRPGTIWSLSTHSQITDAGLASVSRTRAVAEEKVRVTRQLYSSKFGSDMKIIDAIYSGTAFDEELFNASYETFLSRVEKQWDGFITILIPLPKSLFQGEYDGIRYFDDQRYSLPISIFEQEKARKKELETLEQLLAGIKTSYLNAKSAEEAYAQALIKTESAKQDAAKAKAKYRLGQITNQQRAEAEQAAVESEHQTYQAFLSYYSAIYQLDADTSGGVKPYIRPGILPWRAIDDGLAPLHQAPEGVKPLQGSYILQPASAPFTQSLQLHTDPQLGAAFYQIYQSSGQPLSGKLTIDQPFRHLSLLFQSLDDYVVALYSTDQKLLALATFQGVGAEGTLAYETNITVNQKLLGQEPRGSGVWIIGTYKIEMEALSEEIAAAAIATMSDSGQGAYYLSEFSGGWVDLAKALDFSDLTDMKGPAAVAASQIKELKITVSVKEDGAIQSEQLPEEVRSTIAELQAGMLQMREQSEDALSSGDMLTAAQLEAAIQTSEGQISFMDALLSGDAAEAAASLSALNAIRSGKPPADGDSKLAEQLREAVTESKSALHRAIRESGSPEADVAAASAAQAYAGALIELRTLESGVDASLAAFAEARQKLEMAHEAAQAAGDAERADQLEQSLAGLAIQASIEQKQILFIQKEAAEEALAVLVTAGKTDSSLTELRNESIALIAKAELAKYSKIELARLQEEAELLVRKYPGEVIPLPPGNLISQDYVIKFDLPPVIVDGQAMIHIRPISESFGALVVWDPDDQSVTITRNGMVIICTVDETAAYRNGEPVLLEAAPRLINGRTVVPLRFVAASLNIDASWDEATQTIELTEKGDARP